MTETGTSPEEQYRNAMTVLKNLGVPQPEIFYANLAKSYKIAIQHIYRAVISTGTPWIWNEHFYNVLCEHLDVLYMAASSLTIQFKGIKLLAEALGKPLTPHQIAQFDIVIARGRRAADDKMPVSKPLLIELCKAADTIFDKYDATLSKAMFLAAWGGFMRVSEYTNEFDKKGRLRKKDHNLDFYSIDIEDDGFGVTFESDKTSTVFTAPRHRVIDWSFFPDGAQKVFEDYLKIRLSGVPKFFVKMDGCPLTRNEFCDRLEACLLLTRWRGARIVPHSFRVGAASHARKVGYGILEVQYIGRWSKNSTAIEAYTRPDLLNIKPEELPFRKPKYVRTWRFKRLRYISRHVIQTKGDRSHPYHMMLRKHFPKFMSACGAILPKTYPGLQCTYKMTQQWRDRQEGTYVKIYQQACYKRQLEHKRRMLLGRAWKQAFVRGAGMEFFGRLKDLDKIQEIPDFSITAATQTDSVPQIQYQEMSVQTDPVVIVDNPTVPVAEACIDPNEEVIQECLQILQDPNQLQQLQIPGEQDWHTLQVTGNSAIPNDAAQDTEGTVEMRESSVLLAKEVPSSGDKLPPILVGIGSPEFQTLDSSSLQEVGAELDLYTDNTLHTEYVNEHSTGKQWIPQEMEQEHSSDLSSETESDDSEFEGDDVNMETDEKSDSDAGPPPLLGPFDTPPLDLEPESEQFNNEMMQQQHMALSFRDTATSLPLLPRQLEQIERRQLPVDTPGSLVGHSGQILSSKTQDDDLARMQLYSDPAKVLSSRDSYPSRHKNRLQMRFSKFRGKAALVPHYKGVIDGKVHMLTKEEFHEQFPDRRLPPSVVAKVNANINRKIRRRLSSRYRDYLTKLNNRAKDLGKKKRGKLDREPAPPPKIPRLTGTIEALVDIYFDGVYHKGDKALPIHVQTSDSEDSSEDFFYRHINLPTEEEVIEARESDPAFAANLKILEEKNQTGQGGSPQRISEEIWKGILREK